MKWLILKSQRNFSFKSWQQQLYAREYAEKKNNWKIDRKNFPSLLYNATSLLYQSEIEEREKNVRTWNAKWRKKIEGMTKGIKKLFQLIIWILVFQLKSMRKKSFKSFEVKMIKLDTISRCLPEKALKYFHIYRIGNSHTIMSSTKCKKGRKCHAKKTGNKLILKMQFHGALHSAL